MDVRVTVPDVGHQIGDSDLIIRLRTIAGDVGSSSFEVEDDQGTLAIVLHFAASDPDEAKTAARLAHAPRDGVARATLGLAILAARSILTRARRGP